MHELDSPARLPREISWPTKAGPSDHFLVAQCHAGSQDAATQIHVRYVKRLTNLVRSRCSAKLARTAGVEDIVQSIFGTFFRRVGQGFYGVSDGDTVWKLLLVIALNRVRTQATYYYAAKREPAPNHLRDAKHPIALD